MRTTTNYFLLNLSVADLLMSSLNCMFNFIYMLNSDWPFGSVYCSLNNFMGNVTVATSVFTLVAISFNRYVEQFKCMDIEIHITLTYIFIQVKDIGRNVQFISVIVMLWLPHSHPVRTMHILAIFSFVLCFVSFTFDFIVILSKVFFCLQNLQLFI